ncbi:nitroreductase family protein [Methanimicrococcus blatticola]|uniref:Nitroreductase n=1 Tax=Methanimicrococcus blatticola TaxID=91560 RepID=A0A484F4S2_9EURY|nr:nitroreductase family protein [Methanimicrococcus blatticola]MBZ3936005.1 nitroreductase family protein [Methanimicrococcus blatticola]MCC2509382.1 nitroreductase family protein [Methanimicrococcus blatticola]TDQ68265.1 nitroreductase [Methanimicrococcus blatticola]
METMEALYTRRSVRKFQNKSVPMELIEEAVKAAMFAPSARNQQPWEFIIVDKQELMDAVPTYSPHAQMAKGAPAGVLICYNKEYDVAEGFFPQDLGAATQNLLLALHENGLGAVWTGVYPREDRMKGFVNAFNLPENVIPYSFTIIGYPEKETDKVDRFKKERVHYNKW